MEMQDPKSLHSWLLLSSGCREAQKEEWRELIYRLPMCQGIYIDHLICRYYPCSLDKRAQAQRGEVRCPMSNI